MRIASFAVCLLMIASTIPSANAWVDRSILEDFKDAPLYDTNAIDAATLAIDYILDPHPNLITISNVYNDIVWSAEQFTVGFDVTIGPGVGIPVDVTISGVGSSVGCYPDEHTVQKQSVGADEDVHFTLYPPFYAHAKELIGDELDTTVSYTMTGKTTDTAVLEDRYDCPFDVIVTASNLLVTETETANMLVEVLNDVPVDAKIHVGTFIGIEDGRLQWNGHGHVNAEVNLDLPATIYLIGPNPTIDLSFTAQADFQEVQNEVVDSDYMTIQLPDGFAHKVDPTKVIYKSQPVALSSGSSNILCSIGIVWEQDAWQDDYMAGAEICLTVEYRQISAQNPSPIPIENLPEPCQKAIESLLNPSSEVASACQSQTSSTGGISGEDLGVFPVEEDGGKTIYALLGN